MIMMPVLMVAWLVCGVGDEADYENDEDEHDKEKKKKKKKE
jgi:hypothetical protein